ncbi:MAG: Fungal specific transcription factor [Bogoriella megaspora]|nr:MAG: Fungal specific transcription factor [Bogoriella megaspora]
MKPVLPRLAPLPTAGPWPVDTTQLMVEKENIPHTKSISSSGVIANIRSRRDRPCDACRRRKSRCVIHEGKVLCVLCEFHKQDCTFVQSPIPRKRKPNADINEASAKRSPLRRTFSQEDGHTIIKLEEESGPEPITVNSAVLAETLGLQPKRHSRHIGLTSAYDRSLLRLSQFDARNESAADFGTFRKVDDDECFIMFSDDATPSSFNEAEALNTVEQIVAPYGSVLIDLYFRFVHPSFPIIQKQVFLDRHRNNDRQFNSALLAGIYILALNWWSFDERLQGHPHPETRRLAELASQSLASAMKKPKLSTLQAGLLVLQRPDADLWNLTTQLVAVGQELGLHLDCSRWQIPMWEKGLRKRIAWALYMQDKWSSLIHGRPSHIFDANWAARPLTAEDFVEDAPITSEPIQQTAEEKTDIERGQEVFCQMVILTSIMAEVMDTFYTQAAIADFNDAGVGATQLILERAKPVQIKLKEWFANLPAVARMDNTDGSRFSSAGYLHLAYFATEITLHRRIVQSLSTDSSDPYLLYICRSAAKTRLISAMDFVNRLKPQHLQSFWYFASKINFTLIGTFGSLLWATAPTQEEAEFYRMRLREYRWTLSVSSKRAEFLDYAVRMLDSSRALLRGLGEKPSLGREGINEVGVPSVPHVSLGDIGEGLEEVDPQMMSYEEGEGFEGFTNEQLERYGTGA